MRVLITGAAGFIGSNLATHLLDEGHEVIAIDDLSSGVIDNVDSRATFHQADIRSRDIYRLFHGVEGVFHLAAKNCLIDCLKDPVLTADVNITGTANVLEASRQASVRKVIFADTSAEYEGVFDFPSKVERVAPLSVYSRSKNAASAFCEAYQDFYGLAMTRLRYFNVYGPAQDWRRTMPPLMSAFIMRLLRGERPIIYGNGEKRRDFIYIDDVTAFNALTLVDSRTDGHVYNVGTGVNHSINEIYAKVAALLGATLTPVHQAELPGEAEVTLADVEDSLALGWRPRVSLTEGLQRAADYITQVLDPNGQSVR